MNKLEKLEKEKKDLINAMAELCCENCMDLNQRFNSFEGGDSSDVAAYNELDNQLLKIEYKIIDEKNRKRDK